jgi:hypothetical protein
LTESSEIEPHDGHEFDPVRYVTSEQMEAAVTPDITVLDSPEDFAAQQLFVGVGILPAGPSVPDSADHG